MRDSLKNLFGQEVTLDDNTRYTYSIKSYELKNPLGNTAAILQEYTFSKQEPNDSAVIYKLYKTKEGYWYDLEVNVSSPDQHLSRMLKAAINEKENKNMVEEAEP